MVTNLPKFEPLGWPGGPVRTCKICDVTQVIRFLLAALRTCKLNVANSESTN